MTDLTHDDIWRTPLRILSDQLDQNRQMISGQIASDNPDWELVEGWARQARQLTEAIDDLETAARTRSKLQAQELGLRRGQGQ